MFVYVCLLQRNNFAKICFCTPPPKKVGAGISHSLYIYIYPSVYWNHQCVAVQYMFMKLHLCSENSVCSIFYLLMLHVTLSTDVCTRILRLVVSFITYFNAKKHLSSVFSLFFFFGYGIVMASFPRISATESHYKLDICINKCYDAARNLFLETATLVQSALYDFCPFGFLLQF